MPIRLRDENSRRTVLAALLICGVLSAVLLVTVDLVASSRWDAYDYFDQTVSELSAIGAPTQSLWAAFGVLYESLLTAFALGVWLAADRRRALRITALMLGGVAAIGVIWSFFPMHLRGEPRTLTDTMHIVLTGVNAVFTLSAMGFAAVALAKPFRIYSIATMVALVVGGGATSLQAPALDAGLPTPWMGLLERINVYGYLLWVSVLALALLREQYRGRSWRGRVVPVLAGARIGHGR